jgi:probable HAF family extracellular repeat protein
MRSRHLCALALVAALACFAMQASAQQYSITNLGNLPGFSHPAPNSINNLGQVAGGTITSDFSVSHPFLTAPNATIQPSDDLGLLPGATSGSASSVNNSGQVVGTASGYSDYSARAFRLDPGNPTLVDLGTRSGFLSGLASSIANGINDSGQVTGGATESTSASSPCYGAFSSRAFRTAANAPVSGADDLGTLLVGNCRSSVGYAINSSGQVVGNSFAVGSIVGHAFLATPSSSIQDLGTLGGTGSTAYSINDAGQIVGQAEFDPTKPFVNHAFLTTATSTMQDLGTLGGTFSSASWINNSGQIVGNSTTAGDSAVHAFIYQNGTMTDLNTLIPSNSGWVLFGATSINDLGQIVGTGQFNGVDAAFRLDPPGSTGVNILLSELTNSSLPLTGGEISSLSSKLNAALASISKQNVNSAQGQLNAFINQIQALVNSARLSSSDAASLIAGAQNIISNLSF